MSEATKILNEQENIPNLHHTKSPVGQEFCAYTYLLIKEPKTPQYGVIKILCTGSSAMEVEQKVAAMMKSGELEPEIPFVSIRRTGHYSYLVAGGDPKVVKEGVDVQTGELVNEVKKTTADKRKKEMKEMERRLDDLAESGQEKAEASSDPFDTYKYHRIQASMVTQRMKQLEDELEYIKKIKKKAATNIVQLERQHGNFRMRFEKEMEAERKTHLKQMEEARAKILESQEETSIENSNN